MKPLDIHSFPDFVLKVQNDVLETLYDIMIQIIPSKDIVDARFSDRDDLIEFFGVVDVSELVLEHITFSDARMCFYVAGEDYKHVFSSVLNAFKTRFLAHLEFMGEVV